jgi:hypothetical protein
MWTGILPQTRERCERQSGGLAYFFAAYFFTGSTIAE